MAPVRTERFSVLKTPVPDMTATASSSTAAIAAGRAKSAIRARRLPVAARAGLTRAAPMMAIGYS